MQSESKHDTGLRLVMTLYAVMYVLAAVVFVVMIPSVSAIVYEYPVSCSAGMSLSVLLGLHQTKKRLLAMDITKGE